MNIEILNKYKKYMDECMYPYFSKKTFIELYGLMPKLRYHTLLKSLELFYENHGKNIVELGTTRSFVDGQYPGCNTDDVKYWEPENPDIWDWSAGCFTYLIGNIIQKSDCELTTVDLDPSHINRSKHITKDLKNINYVVTFSENYLSNLDKKIDFLYMDTGDMTPIEPTAQLQLREAIILVEKNLISKNGIILIDDVKNPVPKIVAGEESNYGKAKYSIPYLLNNGFKLVMDEYQVLLQKTND